MNNFYFSDSLLPKLRKKNWDISYNKSKGFSGYITIAKIGYNKKYGIEFFWFYLGLEVKTYVGPRKEVT